MHSDDPILQNTDIKSILKADDIKTYKELTQLLHLKAYGGDQKKSQIKNFLHYFDYEKQGRNFIIKEVYDDYRPFEPSSTSGNRSIYVNYITNSIIKRLAAGNRFFTYTSIMLHSGMITPEFIRHKNFKEEQRLLFEERN